MQDWIIGGHKCEAYRRNDVKVGAIRTQQILLIEDIVPDYDREKFEWKIVSQTNRRSFYRLGYAALRLAWWCLLAPRFERLWDFAVSNSNGLGPKGSCFLLSLRIFFQIVCESFIKSS